MFLDLWLKLLSDYQPARQLRGHHLLVRFQNQQSLDILHHAPYLQLSRRCGIRLNLTFGLLPHSPRSNPA